MPQTRLATLRYQALDHCFSNRTRYYFIEDLKNAVNLMLENKGQTLISKCTIFYDIRDMENKNDRNVVFEYIGKHRHNTLETPREKK